MYTVAQDFYLSELDIWLLAGNTLQDGDLEPDVIAQLLSQGTLVSDSISVEDEAPKTSKKSKG